MVSSARSRRGQLNNILFYHFHFFKFFLLIGSEEGRRDGPTQC